MGGHGHGHVARPHPPLPKWIIAAEGAPRQKVILGAIGGALVLSGFVWSVMMASGNQRHFVVCIFGHVEAAHIVQRLVVFGCCSPFFFLLSPPKKMCDFFFSVFFFVLRLYLDLFSFLQAKKFTL